MTKSNFLGGGLLIFFSNQKSSEIRKKELDSSSSISMLAKKTKSNFTFRGLTPQLMCFLVVRSEALHQLGCKTLKCEV